MKQVIRQKKFHDVETLDPTSMTVQGAALSVEELYKKMIVGSIDAAGYVHPVEYDDKPDIDNPDPLNRFGLDIGEVEELRDAHIAKAKEEIERTKAKKEAAKKAADEKKPVVETPKEGEEGQE